MRNTALKKYIDNILLCKIFIIIIAFKIKEKQI